MNYNNVGFLSMRRTANTVSLQSYDAPSLTYKELEMWANAQRDGRPAEYRWRPLFNAAKFG